MESARSVLETPLLERHTVAQNPPMVWPERKPRLLIRLKRRLYEWEQMILGELLALTLPATDFRRR